jgi:hypothetical protein
MGRFHTDLPDCSPESPDFGLIRKTGQPAGDETIALRNLLWAKGRPKGGRAPDPPSVGKIRRTYGYRTGRRECARGFGALTYSCHVRALSISVGGEEEREYSVPAEYVSRREERGLFIPSFDGDGALRIPLPA